MLIFSAKSCLTAFIIFTPHFTNSQYSVYNSTDTSNVGITFFQALSWEQILSKAKAENKYIFVDAFATWCVPCKAMDKNVYPDKRVGDFFNDRFISVKIQMDATPNDNQQVQQWYKAANEMMHRYSVTGFPTLLFFSPSGVLVHKTIGYKNLNSLLQTASFAVSPERLEYYGQIEMYKSGKKNYQIMPDLIKTTKELIGDKKLAQSISIDYKTNYLDSLTEDKLSTKENIMFIYEHSDLISGTKDKFFQLLYQAPDKFDQLLGQKGYSNALVSYFISKEEIWHKFFSDDNTDRPLQMPDWKRVYSDIDSLYGMVYADLIIPEAKIKFYRRIQDWRKWAELHDYNLKKNPPKSSQKNDYFLDTDSWKLNVMAWDVFLHCDDKEVLSKALTWSELSIQLEQPNPNIQYLDTRANLLYKLGRTTEAIAQEEQAIKIDNDVAESSGRDKGSSTNKYTAVLNKMKRGEPTWKELE